MFCLLKEWFSFFPLLFERIAGEEDMHCRVPEWEDIHSPHERSQPALYL